MQNKTRTRLGVMAFVTAATLGLTACGGTESANDNGGNSEQDGSATATEVTDMGGNTVELPENPESIVATDNRIFGTLADWDIELSAAPVDLMPDTETLKPYRENEDILNIGNHREPDFEQVTAAAPDLILNGQRFDQHTEAMQEAAPDATMVDTNIVSSPVDREGQEQEGFRDVADQYRELTTLLGEIFGREQDAEQIVDDFDVAIDNAQAAYDEDWTVAGLITSGGDINYSAPTTGRAVGPVYDIIGLTPALDQDGSANHQGDDISVETIAQANPDWLIVLDRDAGTSARDEEGYSSAEELIEESEALADVTAVKEDQVIYMSPDFYTAEDIQHYTELFNQMSEAFEDAGGAEN
ncbi:MULTISPECIES: siderophore ABC transporter substrate-binding protein [Auritidibacter]|uniref:ABC transporter substrate-binding protein n=1 Tax=Auritidibacter ignavus TaxID=678932 RepID=A0AAJ6AGV9_9MICC|nr:MULTISPECIES: ABC transporter substrate-binding protein [Auritidibacter]AXR73044.1 iron ABC transporter substrate-binding protein [Auritidibacter sp. NML130574]NIH71470.1 iron complex transport system substrate-binding protein [Auritidibacter ignavus]PXA80909.1 iron ABC transporter substrate-binding protein [Auritidibacter sp. NML120636]RMX22832.1 iron ABC transporter substrate-binding protein [Auritidibacter ignavus]WGH81585.1 ABC transporter substrate-binding protein [Auritidibacter ignav